MNTPSNKPAVVVFSGGPDSTAAVLFALREGYTPTLLTFQFKGKEQYGELFAAMLVAQKLGLKHEIIDFRSVMGSFSPLMHILMHAGTPIAQSDHTQPHRSPFGAGMILATASNYAVYNGIDTVIWGATKDDHLGGNPEYSQQFADQMASLVTLGTGFRFTIQVPFADKHKHEAFAWFKGQEDLFAATWSCKEGTTIQTGKSKACIARRLAARLAGITDSTVYSTMEFTSPLPPEKMADPSLISEDDLIRIMQSEVVRDRG